MNDPDVKVEISSTDMQAFVTVGSFRVVASESAPKQMTAHDISSVLKNSGVTYGLDQQAIEAIITETKWDQKILVASGKEPTPGQKARIEYNFDIYSHPHPRELQDGRVDYHDIGLIHCVQKDDVIARKIPATPGIPGMGVRGDNIPATAGEDVQIIAGLNTYFTDTTQSELRASFTGSVTLNKGQIQVENTFIQKGDVCFRSGNIDFPGDVIIRGDIHTGFSVKAAGKVEVSGLIEDATIESAGDVLVKGGFRGSGHGHIYSGGNVFIRFVEQQCVKAEGSVTIADCCIAGTISAKESIHASTGSGTVVGGHLKAGKEIIIQTCGNLQNTLTILELASDQAALGGQIQSSESSIDIHKRLITELKSRMSKLQQQKASSGSADSKLLEEIRRHQDQIFALGRELEQLCKDLQTIQKVLECPGEIRFLKKVFPGTKLIANQVSVITTEIHGKSCFKLVDGEFMDIEAKRFALENEA
ncbi:MAG: FapA family protein [bacterium]|nr:FapA family protein [bacterium]